MLNTDGFSERLRHAINGESSYSFAKKCDFTESLIRKYLAGSSLPGLEKAAVMAQAAGVSLDWLAMGRGEKDALRHQPYQEGDYQQEADDFAYLEELVSTDPGVISRRHAVRRDWLAAQGLDPTKLRFMETREDAMAPTIQPGDRLLCEIYLHWVDGTLKQGLPEGELPPQGGIYLLRYGDLGPTAVRRLRHDMGGGLLLSADADDSLHLHLQGEEQLRQTQIIGRVVSLWRNL